MESKINLKAKVTRDPTRRDTEGDCLCVQGSPKRVSGLGHATRGTWHRVGASHTCSPGARVRRTPLADGRGQPPARRTPTAGRSGRDGHTPESPFNSSVSAEFLSGSGAKRCSSRP